MYNIIVYENKRLETFGNSSKKGNKSRSRKSVE